MKTFEEKFTAWVDGGLKGAELAEFEAELASMKDAEIDRVAAHQVGDLLRDHGHAPALQNPDFFNYQIMQRIEADAPKPKTAPVRARFSWRLPALSLVGAFGTVMALALCYFLMQTPSQNPAQSNVADVISTHPGNSDIVASAFHSQQNNVTVLWLDNLQYMPDKRSQAKKSPQPEKERTPQKPGNH